MQAIPLTQNEFAIIDDKDYPLVSQYKWCYHKFNNKGYAVRGELITKGKIKTIYMHRFITAAPDNMEVDHRNGYTLDNRRQNLRLVTHGQNQYNRKKTKNNTSGYKGVYKHGNKWVSAISVNGKRKRLGTFDDPIQAAKAYDLACQKYHGAYANTNF